MFVLPCHRLRSWILLRSNERPRKKEQFIKISNCFVCVCVCGNIRNGSWQANCQFDVADRFFSILKFSNKKKTKCFFSFFFHIFTKLWETHAIDAVCEIGDETTLARNINESKIFTRKKHYKHFIRVYWRVISHATTESNKIYKIYI